MRRWRGRQRRQSTWFGRALGGLALAVLTAGPGWSAPLPPPRAAGVLYVAKEMSRAYTDDYHQRELDLTWPPLWSRALVGGWRAGLAVEATAGRIADSGDHAVTWSVGPRVELGSRNGRLVLHAGLRPTYLSNYRLGRLNLGMHAQCTSHVGLLVRLVGGLSAGWRVQHLSNGGLDEVNPGINLSTLEAQLAW